MRIPDGWNDVRLDEAASVNPESLGISTPPKFSFKYIDISSVTEGTIDWSTVLIQEYSSSPSRARRVVKNGDVLICTVRPCLQSHVYAAWPDNGDAICSTGFAVIRCTKRLDARYLAHLVFHPLITDQFRSLEIGSSYPAVNESDIRGLKMLLPPCDEQRRIADILDVVEAAIRQTETVIAKLRKVKAGLLHDLLTRGFDKLKGLRDTDEQHEHFKECTLAEITPLRRERGFQGLPTMAVTMHDGLQLRDPSDRRVETRLLPEQHLLARKGDIAYNMMRMWQGACGLAYQDCLLSPAYVVVVPTGIVPSFAYLLFKLPETVRKFHTLSRGLTDDRLRLYHRDFAKIVVRIPRSLSEQQAIVDVVESHANRIRAEEVYRDKLKRQKRGLMHDLLTGAVRV
jgi:type I restriction enzyme S subunit